MSDEFHALEHAVEHVHQRHPHHPQGPDRHPRDRRHLRLFHGVVRAGRDPRREDIHRRGGHRLRQVCLEGARLGRVLEELRYQIVSGAIGLADDRPGGIRYNAALANADFSVRITYSDHWKGMAESERKSIRDGLELTWGPPARLDYSGGRWSARSHVLNGRRGSSPHPLLKVMAEVFRTTDGAGRRIARQTQARSIRSHRRGRAGRARAEVDQAHRPRRRVARAPGGRGLPG